MKQKISPVYAVIAIVVILGVAGLAYWRFEKVTGAPTADPAGSGMPPQVTEELQRKLGGVQPSAAR